MSTGNNVTSREGKEGSPISQSLSPSLINVARLTKRFPGVNALTNVEFDLHSGEVHVLFGENGAGKSTLISVLSGATYPTSGTIEVKGQTAVFDSVQDARDLGIYAVYQEFSLIPQLTIEENMYLGNEFSHLGKIDKKRIHEGAREVIASLGFPLNPKAKVAYLSRAEQQMVEISKAFSGEHPSVLIFDEPTASLTTKEAERLFALIAQAKSSGVGIIYITHRMNEIRMLADRVTVLRDGRVVGTRNVGEIGDDQLVEMMTGRVFEKVFPEIAFSPGKPILKVENVSLSGNLVSGESFEVKAGEIVGLAGLVGSGKSEIGRACFGLEKVTAGRIDFCGTEITNCSVARILAMGMFYLPPDRKTEGLVQIRSVRENMSMASLGLDEFASFGFLKRKAERSKAKQLADRVDLRPKGIEREVEFLSGGNQQKVLIAKALNRETKLLIFDEPTVGVDVGTRIAIYNILKEFCEMGLGILLISSDLSEILHLTNRVYVMHRGRICAHLNDGEISETSVLRHFLDREAA